MDESDHAKYMGIFDSAVVLGDVSKYKYMHEVREPYREADDEDFDMDTQFPSRVKVAYAEV